MVQSVTAIAAMEVMLILTAMKVGRFIEFREAVVLAGGSGMLDRQTMTTDP